MQKIYDHVIRVQEISLVSVYTKFNVQKIYDHVIRVQEISLLFIVYVCWYAENLIANVVYCAKKSI